MHHCAGGTQRAFSLTGSIVLMSLTCLTVPSMTTLLYETLSDHGRADTRTTAVALAKGLMHEILSRHFADPRSAADSSRVKERSRSAYDDVDDYNGLDDKPPRDGSGNVMTRYTDFRTQVAVEDAPSAASGRSPAAPVPHVFKRITVTVKYNGDRDYVQLLGLLATSVPSKQQTHGGTAQQ